VPQRVGNVTSGTPQVPEHVVLALSLELYVGRGPYHNTR
jgi:hypothetical protein